MTTATPILASAPSNAHRCPVCGYDTCVTGSPLPKRYRRCLDRTCAHTYATRELLANDVDDLATAAGEAVEKAEMLWASIDQMQADVKALLTALGGEDWQQRKTGQDAGRK